MPQVPSQYESSQSIKCLVTKDLTWDLNIHVIKSILHPLGLHPTIEQSHPPLTSSTGFSPPPPLQSGTSALRRCPTGEKPRTMVSLGTLTPPAIQNVSVLCLPGHQPPTYSRHLSLLLVGLTHTPRSLYSLSLGYPVFKKRVSAPIPLSNNHLGQLNSHPLPFPTQPTLSLCFGQKWCEKGPNTVESLLPYIKCKYMWMIFTEI